MRRAGRPDAGMLGVRSVALSAAWSARRALPMDRGHPHGVPRARFHHRRPLEQCIDTAGWHTEKADEDYVVFLIHWWA